MSGKKSLSKSVMASLDETDTEMRSTNYFKSRAWLQIGLGILLGLVAGLLIAVIIDEVRDANEYDFSLVSDNDTNELLKVFPWLLAVLSLGAVALSFYLSKQYGTLYRHRMITLFGAVILGVGALSTFALATGTAENLSKTKPFRPFTPAREFLEKNTARGKIIQVIDEDSLLIETPDGRQVQVELREDIRLPFETDFEEGDEFSGFGEYDLDDDDIFEAKGARPHRGLDRKRIKGLFLDRLQDNKEKSEINLHQPE